MPESNTTICYNHTGHRKTLASCKSSYTGTAMTFLIYVFLISGHSLFEKIRCFIHASPITITFMYLCRDFTYFRSVIKIRISSQVFSVSSSITSSTKNLSLYLSPLPMPSWISGFIRWICH